MNYIYSILQHNKFKLLAIYAYLLAGQLLQLFSPYVLGKMIDGLLCNSYKWLWCFLGIEITMNLLMYRRMLYDTKVYTKIYNEIVLNYLKKNVKASSSEKGARTDMAHSIVNFLEHDVHYYIMASVSIVGALIFIFSQHAFTGIVVMLCTVPIALIARFFYPKILKSTRISNNHYEQKFQAIDSECESLIDTYYKRRKRVITYESTLQGKNWASVNSTKTVFLVLSLMVFTHKNVGLTQGQAISMYSYINQFLISLMSIPIGAEIYSRIRDVLKRIQIT